MNNLRQTGHLIGLSLLVALAAATVFFGSYLVRDLTGGIFTPYAQRTEPNPVFPVMGAEWRMHPLDNPGDRLPRGLEVADADSDELDDLLTINQTSGSVRVALHPGASAAGQGWPALEAARVENPLAAGWGDFDGDGGMDIAVLHADSDGRGVISVLWGLGGAAWGAPEKLPVDGWPFTRVQGVDVDQDGDIDILAGGDPAANPRWFENPDTGRDLAGWSGHDLAAGAPGAVYAVGDLDGDGDADLACASAGMLNWYRNPGGEAARLPWPGVELYRGEDLNGEAEVVIADLNGDGQADLLTHSPREVLWWRGDEAANFILERLPKQQASWWRPGPLLVADLNGDGRMDIAGGSRHENGALIKNIAAVWWLERTEQGWYPHVIKWGDGFWGIGQSNGERWARLVALDADGDGDLDLAGLAEEYDRARAILAAAWFENPQR